MKLICKKLYRNGFYIKVIDLLSAELGNARRKEMKKSKRMVEEDAMRVVRMHSREEEILAYGHSVSYARVFRNRKKYYRKQKHKNSKEWQ